MPASESKDAGGELNAGTPVGIRLHLLSSLAPRTKRRIWSAAQSRGSETVEWPTPGITKRWAPGIRAATFADHSGGVRRSSPPCRIRVGTLGYGDAGTADGTRGTSGQRRQKSISS